MAGGFRKRAVRFFLGVLGKKNHGFPLYFDDTYLILSYKPPPGDGVPAPGVDPNLRQNRLSVPTARGSSRKARPKLKPPSSRRLVSSLPSKVGRPPSK